MTVSRDWSYLHIKFYTLYIRRSDQQTLLIDDATRQAVAVRNMWRGRYEDGLFIKLVKGIGVFLMDEEIQYVEVFPEVQVKRERKRRWKNKTA